MKWILGLCTLPKIRTFHNNHIHYPELQPKNPPSFQNWGMGKDFGGFVSTSMYTCAPEVWGDRVWGKIDSKACHNILHYYIKQWHVFSPFLYVFAAAVCFLFVDFSYLGHFIRNWPNKMGATQVAAWSSASVRMRRMAVLGCFCPPPASSPPFPTGFCLQFSSAA